MTEQPQWGIQIPMPDQEWLWVTQGDAKFHIRPLLFDSFQEANQYAVDTWGTGAVIKLYTSNDA